MRVLSLCLRCRDPGHWLSSDSPSKAVGLSPCCTEEMARSDGHVTCRSDSAVIRPPTGATTAIP